LIAAQYARCARYCTDVIDAVVPNDWDIVVVGGHQRG
jgi:hypothetical protein